MTSRVSLRSHLLLRHRLFCFEGAATLWELDVWPRFLAAVSM